MKLKEIYAAILIIAVFVAGGVAWGSNKQQIVTLDKEVKENKDELKEKREVDIQQSLLLRETSVRLEAVGETLKELKKK